ncbi:MAG: hypothetical protein ACRDIZ_07640 [Actinomycetota bacterium]
MLWLQRHGWWGLLAMAVISVAQGLVDLASGVTYQAWHVTGKTIAQIAAESVDGSQLSDFSVRTGGLYLMAFGVLLGAILLFGFRQDRQWAWWAMWTFPVMVITASLLDLAFGDFFAGPATTGGIVGILAAAILLISAPRFFKQPGRPLTDPGENRAG